MTSYLGLDGKEHKLLGRSILFSSAPDGAMLFLDRPYKQETWYLKITKHEYTCPPSSSPKYDFTWPRDEDAYHVVVFE